MSILGSLIVELRAETASFVAGLTGASKTAKTVGREIEESFSTLGGVAASALASFGPIGSFMADTLNHIGESAGGAIQSFGKLGGAMGAVSAVGAGAGAAMLAVTGASLGLASSTALSIAKLGELAQSSGVSVQALSGLSFVGKQVGVDTETMTKGLEKMSKAAFAAATAPAGAANAFTRLHIAVRDSAGEIRPAQDLFADLAGKFAAMPDGVTKTALAMQVFGRGGAELIPVLNRGRDGINDLLDTAQALGVVLDDKTVQASEKFKETMATLEAAGTGLSYELTKELLPALQTVSSFLVEGLKDKSSGLQDLISGFTFITKVVLAFGETLWAVLKQTGIAIGHLAALIIEDISAGARVAADLLMGNFGDAVDDAKDGYARVRGVTSSFISESKKDWADYAAFTAGITAPLAPAVAKTSGPQTKVDLKPTKEDTTLERIRERLKALGEEAAGWANIAKVGTQAEQLIAEAIQKGNVEFQKLKEQAAKDKTGASLPFVNQNESLIKTAEAMNVFGAAVKPVTADLDKQALKMGEQSKIALEMAAAYNKGGSAIADAFVGAKFAEQAGKLDVLVQAHTLAVTTFGKESPATKLLASAIDELTRSLSASADGARNLASAQLTEELAKQSDALLVMKPYVENLNAAYLKSEDAVRAARIELELYRFEQDELAKGIVVSQAEITQKRTILAEADREAYQSSLAQSAAQFDLNRLYDEQVVKLERVREVMQQNGSSTLLIDARLQSAEQQLIKQWDDAAFAVGSFGQKTTAVFNEIILEGQNAGKKIAEAFLSAYDQLTGALAKLATGQKTNFKQIFQGLAEQVTKAEIQKGIGSLTQSLGLGKIPGLAGKADGSDSNPFFVVLKTGKTPSIGGIDTGGVLGKIFGSKKGGDSTGGIFGGDADGSKAKPFYVISAGGGTSSLFGDSGGGDNGGGFSGLGDSFGGFFAAGGTVLPGKWGITGEKGPEVVKGPGTVIPMDKLGRGHQTSITNNFPVMKDYDMFRRSGPQIAAHQHRQMSIAYSRS